MSNRNNLVEFERFLYSIIVVGYHVECTFLRNNDANFFTNGSNAVEFFFLISGYFMARSIEKISNKENPRIFKETLNFMKNKIKTVLPTHIISNIAMIIYMFVKQYPSIWKTILNGLPSFFLVQMVVVWNNSYLQAFNIPEWYISTMLLCMLIMVPFSLLLRKKMDLFFVILILYSIMSVIIVITGFCTKWSFPENFVFDFRGWLEICSGMLAFCFSNYIKNKNFENSTSVILKIIEIVCYNVPVILGFAPISIKYLKIIMTCTVFLTFIGLSITFANKGVVINNEKLNWFFGYLGILSLPIYMFQAIAIFTFFNLGKFDEWAIYLIFISITVCISVIYQIIYDLIIKLIEKIKNRNNGNVIYDNFK